MGFKLFGLRTLKNVNLWKVTEAPGAFVEVSP